MGFEIEENDWKIKMREKYLAFEQDTLAECCLLGEEMGPELGLLYTLIWTVIFRALISFLVWVAKLMRSPWWSFHRLKITPGNYALNISFMHYYQTYQYTHDRRFRSQSEWLKDANVSFNIKWIILGENKQENLPTYCVHVFIFNSIYDLQFTAVGHIPFVFTTDVALESSGLWCCVRALWALQNLHQQ